MVKGLRWLIVMLIAAATVINYIDRNALSVMWPSISKELAMSKNDYALILTFFMISYGFGQAIFGKIFDALGTRVGFLISIVVWSASIALHSLIHNAMSLSILRTTLGLSEAGNWPGATKANAEWFPIKERALAQGIFGMGASLGSIISAPLVAYLYLTLGWKATFVVIGSLGFIWIVPWIIIYKSGPKTHPWLSEAERNYIVTGRKTETEAKIAESSYAPSWWRMLRHKQSWAVILCRFFMDPIWWLFVSWLPLYLADTFHFDIKQIGLFAWGPYVGAAAGALLGGWLARLFIGFGWSVNLARKTVITLACLIMLPSLLLTSQASDPHQAILLIGLVLFGFQLAVSNVQTLPSDYFSGASVGSLAGVSGGAAVLGVLVTTWVVPALSSTSYVVVFIAAAALVPLALLSIFVFGGKIEPIADAKPTSKL